MTVDDVFPHALEGFLTLVVWRLPSNDFINYVRFHIPAHNLSEEFINHSLLGFPKVDEVEGHVPIAQDLIVRVKSCVHFVHEVDIHEAQYIMSRGRVNYLVNSRYWYESLDCVFLGVSSGQLGCCFLKKKT